MMPLTGWLDGRFGIKHIFLASIIGFTIASALCAVKTAAWVWSGSGVAAQ
jgi:DHA2 family multidrug resistance protein